VKIFKSFLIISSLCASHCFGMDRTALDISAKSGIIVDAQTGKCLWEKDADTKRFPASTIKILTALLLIENGNLKDKVTATKEAAQIGEASIYVEPGEKLSVNDLLHAIMVKSANDASYLAATYVSGTSAKFCKLMNERAKQMGCKNTHITNPHGLNDKNSVTTARDLALITREAMKNTLFEEVAKKSKYTLTRDNKKALKNIMSKNRLLREDPTVDGVKIGWTIPAGQCFAGSSMVNGHRIIAVTLNSKGIFDDHKAMIRWATQNHQWQVLAQADKPLTSISIDNAGNGELAVGLKKALSVPVRSTGKAQFKPTYQIKENLKAPIQAGEEVGTVIYKDATGNQFDAPLVALEDIHPRESLTVRNSNLFSITNILSLLVGSSALLFRKLS
jgi:D-alanyl-D-alanine carboxypeptidase (penicillin-binding protein 5/6)